MAKTIKELNDKVLEKDLNYQKRIIQKLIRAIPTESLKDELKRRKVLSIDWVKGSKYMEEIPH